jgi:hypothetical protein
MTLASRCSSRTSKLDRGDDMSAQTRPDAVPLDTDVCNCYEDLSPLAQHMCIYLSLQCLLPRSLSSMSDEFFMYSCFEARILRCTISQLRLICAAPILHTTYIVHPQNVSSNFFKNCCYMRSSSRRFNCALLLYSAITSLVPPREADDVSNISNS